MQVKDKYYSASLIVLPEPREAENALYLSFCELKKRLRSKADKASSNEQKL